MKKLFGLLCCSLLLVGCASQPAPAEATPEATATPEAAATTAPTEAIETQVADGVIEEPMMSTITVNISGQVVSFLKDDSFTVEGELVAGKEIEVTYYGDLTASPTAVSAIVNEATQSVSGTLTDEGMSAITLTQEDGTAISFSKSDSFVSPDQPAIGDTVTINYDGELDGEPIAYAVLKQ